MAVQALSAGTYAILDGVNLGAIVLPDGQALMIDAGLERDAAKKAWRALTGIAQRPVALLITHGHADHFGGAAWFAQQGVPIYAPPLEGLYALEPLLEPLFLYGGAAPIAELQGKFTLARQAIPEFIRLIPGPLTLGDITVQVIPLPGHAPQQMGLGYGPTCFCGDVVFPEETLERHPILFCADLDAWLETLARLPELGYTYYIPGHGPVITDIAERAAANVARLREIRALVWEALSGPREAPEILRAVAAHYALSFSGPAFYLLALTTIQAALTSLQRAGEAVVSVEENRLLWRRV